ncbi:MAG: EAL domain-containing protein [Rhodobacteraceae bacterium]|nr:EAL domain-containing protein [Paracoccaceae bacterium]
MKIRSFLILTFFMAVLIPSLVFGAWSYHDGVKREFASIKDRHLLIAQNLGFALERYHKDIVAAFEAIGESLAAGDAMPHMQRLFSQLNMNFVVNIDKNTGAILQTLAFGETVAPTDLSGEELQHMMSHASTEKTYLSGVVADTNGKNRIYLIRDFGSFVSLGSISTDYFIALGRSISFGIKGHAAIVDQFGSVLAHPLKDWIAARKNIAKVSAVKRMMNGETGIEEFYSPALKGNMIAGLTSVPGAGWGVMVPQPVQEIYEKIYRSLESVFFILTTSLLMTFGIGCLMAKSLSAPLERLATAMQANARKRKLETVGRVAGFIPFREIGDLRNNYNIMVRRVTSAGRRIEKLAYSDTITGLPNRDRLQTLTAPILQESQLPKRGGVMVLVDLDNFKDVNDLHGHDVGDQLLKASAQKLLKVTGDLDLDHNKAGTDPWAPPVVARIGGDEFVIMVQGLIEDAQVEEFLTDLRTELSVPSDDLTFISNASASVGCSRFPQDGRETEELIKRADIAMYHAKKGGKNRSELYSTKIGTRTAAELRRDLLDAIANDHLVLEYQPKICVRRQVINGVEALIRWNHPELGRLMPDVWIPAIHGSHIMDRLGEWVIERAMKDQRKLAEAGFDISMAVNIGSRHFAQSNFITSLDALRSKLDFSPAKLEIEITEDALFVSGDAAMCIFKQLQERGYKVAIDDFGKGYSNIARLASLPFDFLKIDRSIIVGAFEDARTRAILRSTIAMANELDCRTVGEGIETLEQAEFATKMGINCLQGYYFAAAMPLDVLIHWIHHALPEVVEDYQKSLQQAV